MKKDTVKKYIACALLVLFFSMGALYVCVHVLGVHKWKDLDEARLTEINESLRIYDASGALLVCTGIEKRTKLQIETLPDYVKNAFIAAEDERFYQHDGLDLKRVAGALWADIKAGKYKEGASTISMQLVKNSLLTNEKTISRKLQEALLAYQLEKRYSKDEILEMYLNFIYFGNGAYGLEAAAQSYYSKSAALLTLDEAALLAGVINSPARYAPHLKPENSVKRRNTVLSRMLENGLIEKAEYDAACALPLKLNRNAAFSPTYGYAMDAVMQNACTLLGVDMEELLSGGYSITTSINPEIQNYSETIFANNENFPAQMGAAPVQGALVVVENATNSIIGLLGGRSYEARMGLNRALAMRRQPGSAAKPFLAYGAGLESGLFSPATVFTDQRKSFAGYSPANFGDKYYGKITLRQALVKSLNVPAVEALSLTGVEKSKSFAARFGIPFRTEDTGLALALGGFSYGVTPAELAGAFAALANGGQYAANSLIETITGPEGKALYKKTVSRTYACSRETAYLLTDMLQDASVGTVGSHFYNLPFKAAAKTGTVGYQSTDGYSDAWVGAYTPDYTVVVWMGYDYTTPESYLEKGVTGSTYPAQAAASLLQKLHENKKPAAFARPAGIVSVRLDSLSLQRQELAVATEKTPESYVQTELFNAVYAPQSASAYWSIPETPGYFSVGLTDVRQAVITLCVMQDFAQYILYRVEGGSHQPIARLSGTPGEYVQYIDKEAARGQEYGYYVVPQNSRADKSGHLLAGAATATVRVQIPSS